MGLACQRSATLIALNSSINVELFIMHACFVVYGPRAWVLINEAIYASHQSINQQMGFDNLLFELWSWPKSKIHCKLQMINEDYSFKSVRYMCFVINLASDTYIVPWHNTVVSDCYIYTYFRGFPGLELEESEDFLKWTHRFFLYVFEQTASRTVDISVTLCWSKPIALFVKQKIIVQRPRHVRAVHTVHRIKLAKSESSGTKKHGYFDFDF
jgi:hypothetical protein